MFSSQKLFVVAGLAVLCMFVIKTPVVNADYVIPTAIFDHSPEETPGGSHSAETVIDNNPATFAVFVDDDSVTPGIQGHVIFDLGAQYTIHSATLQSRNFFEYLQPDSHDWFYYTDDTPGNHAILDDIGNDSGIVAAYSGSYGWINNGMSETKTFTSPVTARYFGLRVNTSCSVDSFQMAEVSFSTVPEPSTITLLTAALIGLLCYAWKKRS
jgi:hypothetical protein